MSPRATYALDAAAWFLLGAIAGFQLCGWLP